MIAHLILLSLMTFAMFPIFVNLNFVTLCSLVLVPKFTFFRNFVLSLILDTIFLILLVLVKFDSWYHFFDISRFLLNLILGTVCVIFLIFLKFDS